MAKRGVKIRTGNTTVGRPGGWGGTVNRFTGKFVGKSRVGKGSVRRIFAANPADGKLANIGTGKDVNPLVAANQQAQPTPGVRKAPWMGRNANVATTKVSNRGVINRRIRRTNS